MDYFALCMFMHVFVWVVSAYKMFLQILVERKFESGIESGEIAVCCIKVKEMACNQMVLPEVFAIDWYWPQNISKIMLAGKCPYQTDDALRSSVFNQ